MSSFFFFFCNDTATTEIYTLSLHDALPICVRAGVGDGIHLEANQLALPRGAEPDVRSEEQRLNSSHMSISYAVFCLKKKKKQKTKKNSIKKKCKKNQGPDK